MKLIIDIPDNDYKHIKEYYEKNDIVEATYSYIYHGIPLDEVLDKIRAEIKERMRNSGGEPNRDIAFNVCLQIIDKCKAESEIHCNCTDAEIAESFIEDVEAVKDLLPQERSGEE